MLSVVKQYLILGAIIFALIRLWGLGHPCAWAEEEAAPPETPAIEETRAKSSETQAKPSETETPVQYTQTPEPWLDTILVPQDRELEKQIKEVQDSIFTLHQQMVRRKLTLSETDGVEDRNELMQEIELLTKERDMLEGILHDMVDEARATEWTVIDQALERSRKLEFLLDLEEIKEEAVSDRRDESLSN